MLCALNLLGICQTERRPSKLSLLGNNWRMRVHCRRMILRDLQHFISIEQFVPYDQTRVQMRA